MKAKAKAKVGRGKLIPRRGERKGIKGWGRGGQERGLGGTKIIRAAK